MFFSKQLPKKQESNSSQFIDHPLIINETSENYIKMLSFSNLKVGEEINHRSVRIYENDYIHQIYTNSNNNLPHLVFVHGFGGTSMTAIKLFEGLHKEFQVHALDTFGIGYSSRGNFSRKFTVEETEKYFIEAIEEWRKAMKIEKMHLVGHSFGGYIASCYAFKYPDRINHLYLVSPAGICPGVDMGNPEEMDWKRKMFVFAAEKVFKWSIRPSKIMNSWMFGKKLTKQIVNDRLNIPEGEQECWEKYFSYVNSQRISSEGGFYKLFDYPLIPKKNLSVLICDNAQKLGSKFKIDFYFGNYDWMPSEQARQLAEKYHYDNIKITYVPDSGHQIIFDNPAFLTREIKNRVKGY